MPDADVVQLNPRAHQDSSLADALSDTVDYFRKYVSFPDEHCYTAVALWAAHTWVSSSFYITPRLFLSSPEPGSGKTRVLELLNLLTNDAKLTDNVSGPALLVKINQSQLPPTLLVDEVDLLFAQGASENADLRKTLNSGYKKGATTMRVRGTTAEGESDLAEYKSFAPVAMAGIAGNLEAKAPALFTRSIVIHMRKRGSNDHVEDWEEEEAEGDTKHIKQAFEAWAEDGADAARGHKPERVDGVRDRSWELWKTLLIVAELAGPEWAEAGRAAAKWFVVERSANRPLTLEQQLLFDLRDAFGDKTRMHTADIIEALCEPEDLPWKDFNRSQPITASQVARMLSKYAVQPKLMKINRVVARGYEVGGETGLADVWDRYLPR